MSFAGTWLELDGGYYSQETNAVTEKQIVHVLTFKTDLNDENF